MTDREDVLLRSAPLANFFRQNATEGHNHHCGCGRGAAPQSPKAHRGISIRTPHRDGPFDVALPLTELFLYEEIDPGEMGFSPISFAVTSVLVTSKDAFAPAATRPTLLARIAV